MIHLSANCNYVSQWLFNPYWIQTVAAKVVSISGFRNLIFVHRLFNVVESLKYTTPQSPK